MRRSCGALGALVMGGSRSIRVASCHGYDAPGDGCRSAVWRTRGRARSAWWLRARLGRHQAVDDRGAAPRGRPSSIVRWLLGRARRSTWPRWSGSVCSRRALIRRPANLIGVQRLTTRSSGPGPSRARAAPDIVRPPRALGAACRPLNASVRRAMCMSSVRNGRGAEPAWPAVSAWRLREGLATALAGAARLLRSTSAGSCATP